MFPEGIVSQTLLPRAEGTGRVLATEVLVATPAIRNLIREKAVEQIPTSIQTGMQFGMHTMDMSLKTLYQEGIISYEDAIAQVKNVQEFEQLINKI